MRELRQGLPLAEQTCIRVEWQVIRQGYLCVVSSRVCLAEEEVWLAVRAEVANRAERERAGFHRRRDYETGAPRATKYRPTACLGKRMLLMPRQHAENERES